MVWRIIVEFVSSICKSLLMKPPVDFGSPTFAGIYIYKPPPGLPHTGEESCNENFQYTGGFHQVIVLVIALSEFGAAGKLKGGYSFIVF
jgi:hypothetical protein